METSTCTCSEIPSGWLCDSCLDEKESKRPPFSPFGVPEELNPKRDFAGAIEANERRAQLAGL